MHANSMYGSFSQISRSVFWICTTVLSMARVRTHRVVLIVFVILGTLEMVESVLVSH